MRGLALGGLALITLAATGVVLASPSTAEEPALLTSLGTQLPVEDFRAIELDEDRGRLYLAQGAGSELPLVVTDLDGVLKTKVTSVTGISDVVLSDDHKTLLVAQDFVRVTAVDADMLTPTATYDAPKGRPEPPQSLGQASEYVFGWVGRAAKDPHRPTLWRNFKTSPGVGLFLHAGSQHRPTRQNGYRCPRALSGHTPQQSPSLRGTS